MSIKISTEKPCICMKELMESQRKAFEKAAEENKYFLSEKAHNDVGREVALNDFLSNHFNQWSENFRTNFCNNCSGKSVCKINFSLS